MDAFDRYRFTDSGVFQCLHVPSSPVSFDGLNHDAAGHVFAQSHAALLDLYDQVAAEGADDAHLAAHVEPQIFQMLFYLRAAADLPDDQIFLMKHTSPARHIVNGSTSAPPSLPDRAVVCCTVRAILAL